MDKIKSDELEQYAKAFSESFLESAKSYLSPSDMKYSIYGKYLPAHIECLVSTQNGVALLYHPNKQMSYSNRYDSKRIEDMVFPFPAGSSKKVAFDISGKDIKIHDCKVSGMPPIRFHGEDASVFIENLLWQLKTGKFSSLKFVEIYSNRNPSLYTRETGIKKGRDEILKILALKYLSSERKMDVTEFIKNHKDKTVLILGKDSSEEAYNRLKQIKLIVSVRNLTPILMKEIPDNPHQDLKEKLGLLASISRFVLVDDTEPSGHLEELSILKELGCIVGLIQPKDRPSSFMHLTYASKYSWSAKKEYEKNTFIKDIHELIDACEQIIIKKRMALQEYIGLIRNQKDEELIGFDSSG